MSECQKSHDGQHGFNGGRCEWCNEHQPSAHASSGGQAALVERLRDAACDARLSMKPVSLLTEAADALSTASPAPACASCADYHRVLAGQARETHRARQALKHIAATCGSLGQAMAIASAALKGQ
jgi:hypothetical protein